ncbi:MAG: AMP-binding protein [Thermaerobacter sp.]|nr:AMP-binding protein [Thermaerobacter sp.]
MELPLTPVDFLRRAGAIYEDEVGVVAGDRVLTYGQFLDLAEHLAGFLATHGVRPGDRVAWLGMQRVEFLAAYFAVPGIGAILAPINARLAPAEIRYILDDLDVKLMVEDLPQFDPEGVAGHTVISFAGAKGLGQAIWQSHPMSLGCGSESQVAEIFYTSGSTGKPKGVMLTHRNIFTNAVNFALMHQINDLDVVYHAIPLFHVNAWGLPHAATWLGARQILPDRFQAEQTLDAVERERVTLLCAVPTMVEALIDGQLRRPRDLSSLRRLIVGGSPIPEELGGRILRHLGVPYAQAYGLTETAPALTVGNPRRGVPQGVDWGLPVPSAELRVVDNSGQPVPRDGATLGEIVARGNSVMAGYWRRPADTEAAMVGGWLHTGDLGVVARSGAIRVVDRKKDLIISGGENIAPVEVENAILSHPGVLDVGVVGVPDPRWNEVPVAFVVPRAALKVEEIHAFLQGKLARFKQPKKIYLLEELPKTGTGKVRKDELRRLAQGSTAGKG